jgi:hypothetical protein
MSAIPALPNAVLLAPAAKTSTFNSSSVDLQQYVQPAKMIVNVGTVSGTTPTLDGKVQDSADNSTFADVTGYTFTQVTASGIASLAIDPRAVRRYVRYVGTIAGTTPSFTMGVELVGRTKTL